MASTSQRRLEGIAEPGGICISSSAYDQVRGKVAVEFADLGRAEPQEYRPSGAGLCRGLERICPGDRNGAAIRSSSAPRLSIVVLPFANIGGDPEQDYFVDGVTESLTTDLSRISGSFVIATTHRIYVQGQSG